MKSLHIDKVFAHLRLQAIWPAMAELIVYSKVAREVIRGWDLEISLGVMDDTQVAVAFQEALQKSDKGKPRHRLALKTLTHRQLNRLFENKLFFPIISGNFLQLSKLKKLKSLSTLLETFLEPTPQMLEDPYFLEQYARMMLGVLMRSAAVVGDLDLQAQSMLQKMKGGTLLFQIHDTQNTLFEASVHHEYARLGVLADVSTLAPNVVVSFDSAQTFVLMIQNKLDFQAAVGLGKVTVKGFLPLLDGMSVVMERASFYLNQLRTCSTA